MIDAQPLVLRLDPIIHVGDLQPLGGLVQHAADTPVRIEVQLRFGKLAGRGGCFGLDVQIDAFVRDEVRVALCGLPERAEGGELGGPAAGFGFGPERVLGVFAPRSEPGEAEAHLLGLRYEMVGLAGAQGRDGLAVVFFSEAVFEAVLPVAVVASGAGVLDRVDDGFALCL